MKRDTWKMVLQIAISILTAIATTLGVTSCVGSKLKMKNGRSPLPHEEAVIFFVFRSLRSRSLRSLRISDYQNIPLSYKIRLNQVRPANKIHPYNHFSEYFFCIFAEI